MIHRSEKICPRCDAPNVKAWVKLTDEEKDMLARLGKGPERPDEKKHRICTRCWFRDEGERMLLV